MTQLYADEAFLEYYQFEHDPFLGRGSSFKFFAAKRRPVLVELHHLARYSKLILVVTGPQGSGKTVLRQALVASSKETVKSIVIAPSTTADAAAMLQHMCVALGLHNADIATVLGHIEHMQLTGQSVHVIVDNAECLDESALLFLQRIAQGVNDACARVFVFSDSEIRLLLKKVADNADLHHVIALEPWSEQEVNEYLEQRLIAAGQTLDVFTDQQLALIYTESQGWPGQINSVAKDILLEQVHAEIKQQKSAFAIPVKHLGILAVVGVALAFLWFMQTPESDQSASIVGVDSSALEAGDTAGPAKTLTRALPLGEPVIREPLAQALTEDDEESMSLEQEQSLALQSIDTPAPVIRAPVPISVPKPISVAPIQPKPVMTASKVEPVRPVQAVVQKPQPIAPAPAKPVAPVVIAPKVNPAPAPVKPVAIAPKVNPAPVAAAPIAAVSTAADTQWYRQQTKTHYTLQMLGTRSEAAALAFVNQNKGQYRYFKKIHQGKAMFVVTFGSFADRAAAQVALKSLPEKLQKDKPWPRTFLSIQQELR